MKKIVCALGLILWCGLSMAAPKKVGLIQSDRTDPREVEAFRAELQKTPQVEVTVLELSKLPQLSDFEVLFYHRSDSSSVSRAEQAAQKKILPYVSGGGDLVLSMDGVRLLNEWGIEPQPLQAETRKLVDVGHGRAVGYRGYLEHPFFEGLDGGAYVWFSPEDHFVRTVGFSGSAIPQAPLAKVLGIEWLYIRYNEARKLVWQTPVGKGRIVAIGGYLYFSRQNLNDKVLSRFTQNVLGYLTGSPSTSNANGWSYDTTRAASSTYPLSLRAEGCAPWAAPSSALDYTRRADKNFTWDLGGPQVLAMGTEKAGIKEVWMHPVMAMADYMVGIKLTNRDTVVWAKQLMPRVTNSPSRLTRSYTIPQSNARFEETIVADNLAPLLAVDYRFEGDQIEKIYIKYTSNLRLMWPYSADCIGPLYVAQSLDRSATLVHDTLRRFNVVTQFSSAPERTASGLYSDFEVRSSRLVGQETSLRKLGFIYQFNAPTTPNLRVLVSGGGTGIDAAVATIGQEQSASPSIEKRSHQYYENFNKAFISIHTNDSLFNTNYRWAMIALDQMYCNTPGIGKSMFAGFSTTDKGWGGGHKVSGRPGYAWYFGRDAEWMGMTLCYLGNYEKVRNILETLGKTQSIDGKIYHEYTTSGSVHYDAADATPLYVILFNQYVQKTGDLAFLKEQWPRVKKSIEYCFSTDTDGDHLIENTNQGHGWIEGGALYGFHTTIYMAGVWVHMLDQAATMAQLMGEQPLAQKCVETRPKAYQALNTRFWNDQTRFFNKGLWRDGTFSTEQAMLAAVPVLLGSVEPQKAEWCIDQIATKYFSTDWGVRMLPYYSKLYDPKGYHYGSVWPLFTGWTAMAEYKVGQNIQAFRHVMNNILLHTKWDYGAAPEVLGGEQFLPAGVCMHQGWSSSMTLLPIYTGLLGISANGLDHTLDLAPVFPIDWTECRVENIPVGGQKVAMDYQRTIGDHHFVLSVGSGVSVRFAPKLPLGSQVKSVAVDGQNVPYRLQYHRGSVQVVLEQAVTTPQARIEIRTDGAIAVLANLKKLEVGDTDTGIKIPNESFQDGVYRLLLQGKGGSTERIELFHQGNIESIEGAKVVRHHPKTSISTLEVTFDQGTDPFTDRLIKIKR